MLFRSEGAAGLCVEIQCFAAHIDENNDSDVTYMGMSSRSLWSEFSGLHCTLMRIPIRRTCHWHYDGQWEISCVVEIQCFAAHIDENNDSDVTYM